MNTDAGPSGTFHRCLQNHDPERQLVPSAGFFEVRHGVSLVASRPSLNADNSRNFAGPSLSCQSAALPPVRQ